MCVCVAASAGHIAGWQDMISVMGDTHTQMVVNPSTMVSLMHVAGTHTHHLYVSRLSDRLMFNKALFIQHGI